MQEMDLRNRDIRYTEALLIVTVIEMLGQNILDALAAGLRLEGKHTFTTEKIGKLVEIYRDKLFHHGYLPDYERRLNEALHVKGGKMKERTKQDIENLNRVDRLTDADPM